MSLFEYLTVAVSIVLSMSIVRSLENVGDVLDPRRRDAIHLAWFAIKAFQPVISWWAIWGLNDETDWNFLAFIACLAGPVFLFFQVTTLTTREPDEVEDWGAHFMRVRHRFFGAQVADAFTPPILVAALGSGGLPEMAVVTSFQLTVAIIGLSSADRRVHRALIAGVALGHLVAMGFLFQPITPTPAS